MRMAEEDPTWGYTRIVGTLKNVGHSVSRSPISRILKAHGMICVLLMCGTSEGDSGVTGHERSAFFDRF